RTLPSNVLPIVVRELRIGKNIGDMDRSAFERRAPGGRAAIDRNGVLLEPTSMFRGHPARCGLMDFVLAGLADEIILGRRTPRGGAGDSVEHRPHLGRRAADYVEPLAGCSLIFQSLL